MFNRELKMENNSKFKIQNLPLNKKIAIAGTGYVGLSNGSLSNGSLWTQDDEVVALASLTPYFSGEYIVQGFV